MDAEAALFMFEIEHDPWAAITEPLPESLDDRMTQLGLIVLPTKNVLVEEKSCLGPAYVRRRLPPCPNCVTGHCFA